MAKFNKAVIAKKLDFDLNLSDEFNTSLKSNSSSDCELDTSYSNTWNNHTYRNQKIPQILVSTNDSTPPHKFLKRFAFQDVHTIPKPFSINNLSKLSFKEANSPSSEKRPTVNINPYTPTGRKILSKKRSRSGRKLFNSEKKPEIDDNSNNSEHEEHFIPRKKCLQETNINRYNKEFHEICLLGNGEFGSVYKCQNRLDGCYYAIKKSIKNVAKGLNIRTALNEVHAHAVLGRHDYVVQYYSAWSENEHVIIQNEYCNGGSLADAIENNRQNNTPMTEEQLQILLNHTINGLKHIHTMKLVHMDIKPANIFISSESKLNSSISESTDDGFEDEDNSGSNKEVKSNHIVYKIGDLGHVTCIENPEVEEGDCRYMSNEILRENFDNLPKADIFALGLTVYEAASGEPLPKNGLAWHEIRSGKLPRLEQYSRELNELILLMIDPDPKRRPTADDLLNHPYLKPGCTKSKDELNRELVEEKLKNEFLTQRLEQTLDFIKSFNIKSIPSKLKISPFPQNTKTSFSRSFSNTEF